ncbi:hypothetical protein ACHAQA_006766 [Verticillium albo-atrum]
MSFYAGDSRIPEGPPPPHGGLKTSEIGVIVGAVSAVVLFVSIIFIRRVCLTKRNQRRAREENDAESGHHPGEAAEHKGNADDPFRNDASSAENPQPRPKIAKLKLPSYLPRAITTRLFKPQTEPDTELAPRYN